MEERMGSTVTAVSGSSKVISGSAVDEQSFISQKQYRPTPYVATNWEVVGERAKDVNFTPMQISIIQSEDSATDPMFEVFDRGLSGDGAELYVVGKGAISLSGEVSEEDKAQIIAEQKAALEQQWLAKVEEARQQGYEEGEKAAQATILEKYEALSTQLQEIIGGIQAEWKGLSGKLEQEALSLALQVSKRIIPAVADLKPDYILQTIRDGLRRLGAAEPVRIRVSEADYEFLTVIGLPVELSTEELGVTYVADESIQSGCVVETNFGELDLQLDQMWEQLRVSIEEAFRV